MAEEAVVEEEEEEEEAVASNPAAESKPVRVTPNNALSETCG